MVKSGKVFQTAKTAGFCFGVNRAVKILNKIVDEGRNVCTLGPIIHNPIVIEDLESKGVKIIDSPSQTPEGFEIVIREHGVTGQLVPVKNVEAMTEAIDFYIQNPKMAEEMGKNARERLKEATVEKIYQQWKKYILSVAK